MIQVVLHPGELTNIGQRYDVSIVDASGNDHPLVKGSLDPEYTAARALLALGHHGPFETLDEKTRKVRMRFPSIEAAAKLRTDERSSGADKPRTAKWKPFLATPGAPSLSEEENPGA